MDVNARAVRAADDEDEFERLVTEYRPFIASCACKATGKRVDSHDDEMSIALIAFSEAVRRFRPESGNFLSYASKVIHSRLIDHMREAKRNVDTISLDYNPQDAEAAGRPDRLRHPNLTRSPESRFDDPLKLEIDALTQELRQFGFGFMDVAKCSPRAAKTKLACKRVSLCIARDPELYGEMKRTKQLPVQKLEEAAGVSRKTIGRHRNYIVCLAQILSGEYACLSEYVKIGLKGEQK